MLPSREILCTVGPASLDDRVIRRLDDLGVTLFRINLSHTKLKDLPHVVEFIRSRTRVPICLDTEGAQIRTGDFVGGDIAIRENSVVHAHRGPVPGDSANFNFYPEGVVDLLEEGDFISIDFNSVLVQVVGKDTQKASMRVIVGGVIGRNKAVTVERDIALSPLTPKDRAALAWGRTSGIRHVALSFANRGEDVDLARSVTGTDTFLISKIECRNGLVNLDEIATKSDALLIDRGDLSRQEPIERIPALQKMIIRRGNSLDRKVFVATNLLESMISATKPTRAEVNDVVNTLLDGADGLVLAAETAIGRDPVGCVTMVVRLISEFDQYRRGAVAVGERYRAVSSLSFLPAPHGGALIEQRLAPADLDAADRLPRWYACARALAEAESIASGVYSPLQGFLGKADVRSVQESCRLADGVVWPLPIVLGIDVSHARSLVAGQRIALADGSGVVRAALDVSEIFDADIPSGGFGSIATMTAVDATGDCRFVAGRVSLVRRIQSGAGREQLSPRESRFVFQHKGWQRIVGAKARSVSDRFQEHAQRAALEDIQADGLFVSVPSEGREVGEYLAEPILQSYRALVDFGYFPEGKLLVTALPDYRSGRGPREAVLSALCAKNFGCSHFLLDASTGSDQSNEPRAILALFDALGDLGVMPLVVPDLRFDPMTHRYVDGPGSTLLAPVAIESSRKAILRQEDLPDWFMRDIIQVTLRNRIAGDQPVFYDPISA